MVGQKLSVQFRLQYNYQASATKKIAGIPIPGSSSGDTGLELQDYISPQCYIYAFPSMTSSGNKPVQSIDVSLPNCNKELFVGMKVESTRQQ